MNCVKMVSAFGLQHVFVVCSTYQIIVVEGAPTEHVSKGFMSIVWCGSNLGSSDDKLLSKCTLCMLAAVSAMIS